jgi:hypothetical protein
MFQLQLAIALATTTTDVCLGGSARHDSFLSQSLKSLNHSFFFEKR